MKTVALSSTNNSFLSYLRQPIYTNKHYAAQQFCLNELRHEEGSKTLHDIMHENESGSWHVNSKRLQFDSRDFLGHKSCVFKVLFTHSIAIKRNWRLY
jgi:hypothetical protein